MLTLEERTRTDIRELIPGRLDGTPVALDVFDRLRKVINSAMKVQNALPDLTQWDFDNADLCQEMLKNVGCNPQDCAGNGAKPYWELPQHLFQHLNTVCIAYHDEDINKGHDSNGSCKWCTGGVMDNFERRNYTEAYKAWREKVAEENKKAEENKEAEKKASPKKTKKADKVAA